MERDYSRSRAVFAGAVAGLATCVSYAVLAADVVPEEAAVVLAATFGPLLGAASWGLREFVSLYRRSLGADLAAACNAIGGALFTAMLLVQLAVDERTNDAPGEGLKAVWLGLDVAWDTYIALGTVLFAIAALHHPRLGKWFGAAGILAGAALLSLNLLSFPTPPADDGLVDAGPLIGLWYLAVTTVMFRSAAWSREAEARAVLSEESAGTAVAG